VIILILNNLIKKFLPNQVERGYRRLTANTPLPFDLSDQIGLRFKAFDVVSEDVREVPQDLLRPLDVSQIRAVFFDMDSMLIDTVTARCDCRCQKMG